MLQTNRKDPASYLIAKNEQEMNQKNKSMSSADGRKTEASDRLPGSYRCPAL